VLFEVALPPPPPVAAALFFFFYGSMRVSYQFVFIRDSYMRFLEEEEHTHTHTHTHKL